MEFLKAQGAYIARQVRDLSVSQRIAVALLVILVLAGMWGMVLWGGQGEWSPLLDQSLASDQLSRISAELTMVGIDSKVQGDRLLVRGDEDRRRQVMALLAQRGALPRDTSMGYASLIRENSVFMGDRSRVWMEHRGLETELSGVLRKFQGVRDAHVFIEVPQQRTFGERGKGSRASVHVTLGAGETLDKQRVMAVASLVAGAVPGLELRDVKITDGTRFYRVPDASGEMPTELLDIQRQAEDHHTQKIYDQLRYIPGVLVNVHAALAHAEEQSQEKKLGPAVVDQESTRTEEMTGPGGAAAPGVRPNQGRSINETAAGAGTAREETETSLRGERDARLVTTHKRAGYVEKLTASINVPRSYLERVSGKPSGGSGDAPIDKVAEIELPKIKSLVRALINATSDDQVVVNWYHDLPAGESQAAPGAQQAGWLLIAKDYGPQVGLGLLAVISLWGVLRIARKAQATIGASKRPAGGSVAWSGLGDSDVVGPLPSLGGGPATVGEAQEIEGVMVGHEVDEGTVRVQQIARQIGQLIKEDPVVAAGIVQHWLAEDN